MSENCAIKSNQSAGEVCWDILLTCLPCLPVVSCVKNMVKNMVSSQCTSNTHFPLQKTWQKLISDTLCRNRHVFSEQSWRLFSAAVIRHLKSPSGHVWMSPGISNVIYLNNVRNRTLRKRLHCNYQWLQSLVAVCVRMCVLPRLGVIITIIIVISITAIYTPAINTIQWLC